MFEGLITVKEATERYGISDGYLRLLLGRGTLEGMKVSRDWLIKIDSLEHYMTNRKKRGPKPGSRRKDQ